MNKFTLSGEERSLDYLLRLPDAAAEIRLGTELKYRNQTEYRLYGRYSLSMTVSDSSAGLLASIIEELQGMFVTGRDAGHVTNAIGYLELVQDNEGITRPEVEANIDNILKALKELEKVSADVSALRLRLDELLKIWQTKWSLSAFNSPLTKGAEGVVDNRYRLAYETDARKISGKATIACHSGLSGIGCSRYVLLASTGSTSGLLNTPSSDVIYFYHVDHLGTPVMMTDQNQQVVWSGEFLPFGEEYSITGTVTNNLRFTGQYYDEETGLHQNWHRDYMPEMGRYIQRDPIGFEGGINQWIYAGDNPVNFIDPLGLAYGNTTCTYYKTRCSDANTKKGKLYYCGLVQVACEIAHIPFTNWDQCTRQCLQEYDFYHKQCSNSRGDYSFDDFKDSHSYCFSECFKNSNKDPIQPLQ